jgi:hypothetical protein
VPVGAEDDQVGALTHGERPQAVAGRAAEHDVAGDLGMTEPLRAALEQPLCLRLCGLLGSGVGLGAVAHIGERHARAGVTEDPCQRQSVVVVVGSVVGDDHMGLHRRSLLKRVAALRSEVRRRRAAGSVF